jgi:hypothetical protein
MMAIFGVVASVLSEHWWLLILVLPSVAFAGLWVRHASVVATARKYTLRRGALGVLVYSNSPNWKDYIEQTWLPATGDRLIVLNWSERQNWTADPAVTVFNALGGEEDFNPLAILFTRKQPLVFRFYPAFQNAKHGNREGLEMLERAFLQEFERATN